MMTHTTLVTPRCYWHRVDKGLKWRQISYKPRHENILGPEADFLARKIIEINCSFLDTNSIVWKKM